MTFRNSVLGAAGVLIRKAIRTPDYNPAIAGWSLMQGGSAEFNGKVVARSFHTGDPTVNATRVSLRDSAGGDVEFFINPRVALVARARAVKTQTALPDFPKSEDSTPSFSNSGTSPAASYPATVNDGDLLIFQAQANANNTITVAPGWTRLANHATGGPGTWECWARIAPISNTLGGTTFPVALSADQAIAFEVRRYSNTRGGIVLGTDLEIAVTSGWTDTSTPDPPSVTTTWAAEDNTFLALGGGRGDNDVASAAPANYGDLTTSVTTNGGGGGAEVYSADRDLNGTTDNPGAFTLPGTERTFAATLAIRPSSGGGGTIDTYLIAVEADDMHPNDGRPRLLLIQSDDASVAASAEIGLELSATVRCSEAEISLNGAPKVVTDSLSTSTTAGTPIHHNATTNELFRYTGP